MTPRQNSNPDSGITLAASYGKSDGKSYYVDLCKNLPPRSARTPELKGHTHKLQHMHEVALVDIEEFNYPTELSTHPNKVKPTVIANEKTIRPENHQDNVASPPYGTQPSLMHSPLADASVASEPPPLRPRIYARDAARLASSDNHPKVRLKAAGDALFSVYQDWVHQNTGTNLYGGTNKGDKWQDRFRKIVCLPTQRYDIPSGRVEIFSSQPLQRSLAVYEIRNGTPSR